ncbi:chromate transporter [Sporosarcina sp. 179-K 3D1 HS]|uniref:chromate transporter n=1 Tax=Sporosarcina sp. 179-K 3D1 HS TaxID=3232169 RepID=UPI0039A25650
MLWSLFITFFLIGFVSFGGGYAIIPVIEHETLRHGWMTSQQLIDIIAIAGMSPGPIATNTAVFIGFQTEGVLGAFISAVAITLPSILIVFLIAVFFYKINDKPIVQTAFYGLRPVITALILFAAFSFSKTNGLLSLTRDAAIGIILFSLGLFALWKLKWHPALIILIAGVLGVIVY